MARQATGGQAECPERVVLFGSEGGFSRAVLQRLLAEGTSVIGVVMPGMAASAPGQREIPVAVKPSTTSSLAGLATSRSLPILSMGSGQTRQLADELAVLAADVLLVACFPLHIPRSIWQQLPSACWNLHPSLLPKYRGPAPLFWQLRLHERNTGVTLHEVSDRFDAGNILAQACRALPFETSTAGLDAWVAETGVGLFLDTLQRFRKGCLVATPQDEASASYFPYPGESDRTH